ncbi:hypothetical protein FHETE_2683 [Fusarium heterosporum]|uniref:Xylanolytic transcriptional activator regulatory domain-containing protein n=1 Tax=Fusarium heterosporum TaxID=42747 RepID=A0A8H5TV29_FUSHE|nr:hypothetical protein FHETE_2683 [Fusarium heterosporum]
MQAAIDTLGHKLDLQARRNVDQDDDDVEPQRGETDTQPKTPLLEYYRCRKKNPKPQANPEMSVPEQSDSELDSAVDDILPNRLTLLKILEYTEQFWPTCPLTAINSPEPTRPRGIPPHVSEEDYVGFPESLESALSFIDLSLRSVDFGVVSRCMVWLCLCYQQLPGDFTDVETDTPFNSQESIDRYLLRVETWYQVRSVPVCNLSFVEALALRSELFLAMGCPSKAWQSTRAALDSAMLLGLYRPSRSHRERDAWETLWIQDRRISLFLGLPYSVPEHLTSDPLGEKHISLEKKALRKLAIVSGHISDRDLLGSDAPYSDTERIIEEMNELRAMIPVKWGTKRDLATSSFAQAFTHGMIKFFYYTTKQMVHLPFAQHSEEDERTKHNKIAGFDAAEGAVLVYQAIRALEITPYIPTRNEFLDFVGFSSALILSSDLVSVIPGTSSLKEQQERWEKVMELTKTMRRLSDELDFTVAGHAADVLEHFQAGSNGSFNSCEAYEVTIPYFGEMKVSRNVPNKKLHAGLRKPSEMDKFYIELETNAFTFRRANECLNDKEMLEAWDADYGFDFTWDWKNKYEFWGSDM